MVKKICLALALITMAGVAFAGEDGDHGDESGSNKCVHFFGFEYCLPSEHHEPPLVSAPEIDPSSAMAGLTLMVGGLAVLRGRRRITSAAK